MQNALLLLTLTTASVGYIFWYAMSSSLRLPIRYQIMYDANPPYVNRVLRRRTISAIILAGIPLFIIFCTGWIQRPTWNELNISLRWNNSVTLISGIGTLLVVLYSYLNARTQANLEVYPEVRIRFWRPRLLFLSGLTWLLFIFVQEFFYRGLLFQSLLNKLDLVQAIAASTALYSLTHYFRLNRLTTASVAWGIISCLIVHHTGSLWPSIIIHLALCLSLEWFSIRYHMEMYVRKT